MTNAELIKRALYFHADDLGGLVLPLVTALQDAEAERDAALVKLQEIRQVPCWQNPETGVGGFDVDGEEWNIIDDIIHGRKEPRTRPRPLPRRATRSNEETFSERMAAQSVQALEAKCGPLT